MCGLALQYLDDGGCHINFKPLNAYYGWISKFFEFYSINTIDKQSKPRYVDVCYPDLSHENSLLTISDGALRRLRYISS